MCRSPWASIRTRATSRILRWRKRWASRIPHCPSCHNWRASLIFCFYKCEFKKSGFQHREDCENLKKEERSVGKTYMSTGLRR
ncbi:hypothetical protein EJQ19_10525 [Paenibacillus whitsoniae]|uniref:Uncharacterized protein n=1 Tax=Paenibacillus whitsoniae TaxID=2496558 RepID=A0A3S0A4X4_9BACL|nr:hypothetical protein EJQ19_10525 [Paenibacillus whitsoniae]